MGKIKDDRQIEELLKTDFSIQSRSKEKILNQLLYEINNQECMNGKKENFAMISFFKKPIFIAAALAVFVMSFSMTSYGNDFYKKIKEVFVGDHARYVVTEQTSEPNRTIPDELKGKLYDKKGNVLKQYPKNGTVYNANGEQLILSYVESQDGDGNTISKYEALTQKEYDERQRSKMTTMTNLEEAKPYLSFNFSLPRYMPKGYAFDRVQLYNDENGKPYKDGEYAIVFFSNGDRTKDIYLQLRQMNERTAYEADIGDVEQIEINGKKGVIGKGNIHVEIDGVMYMFMASKAGIDNEQLIKMVDSIPYQNE
ncbi:DUF4367 domain-containing protein [Desulforamulus ruminis]|uniref:DUF4367 domain-containing protein n=1 Tax=Desulforamulus ruminis (strain ATCC 23193 / DSM 2154 / NCIMB 8452 / DL) TaxID=696281 RepID=F6DUW6_DESRL|nr:DUF4367 domain-containing protein [Desulforamulus ruminis]AEG61363.1 hypothetical protein Desru_3152 [Desulforamulus ruminis DSM 2154]